MRLRYRLSSIYKIDPGVEEVDVYEDLDPIEPLDDPFEDLPQSDLDDIEEGPSEGPYPVEYSDADVGVRPRGSACCGI
ncbi:hypothetical protein RIF29_29921 [Crotalaria pallida]|uniref:Uncharacterized protein n=1 Tax=Crotalaria pallida TaxID=3830 RepID=A0AAN9EHR5_CROPI